MNETNKINNSFKVFQKAQNPYKYLTDVLWPKVNNYVLLGLLALFAASSGTAYYFYSKTVTVTPADQQAATRAESKALVAQIGRLILLPENEEPTVATVSDPNALKNQPFFAKAKKGDRLLLYTTAKKAILYDPVDDKIVEVAPIVIGNPTPQAPAPAK